ncbi:MAG: carboxypeptidase regulatory-like domain-containing protein [Chthonomonas sp.]|nr:carboxypeptidase regulatory-like domain-containing protein [Chthonomonas sp.]
MKRLNVGLLTLAAVILAGCGGQTATRSVTVSGRITDVDGAPIRGATVTAGSATTTSSTNGAYVLDRVLSIDQAVIAEYVDGNGVTYRGRNLARVSEGEQTISVNMMIAPTSSLARISGYVEDRFGNRIVGARVFAYGGGAYSSSSAVSGDNGRFVIRDLISGVDYQLNAGAVGYSNDFDSATLNAGQERSMLFVLGDAGFPVLPAPTGLTTLAWTSQPASRDARHNAAMTQVKSLFDPGYATRRAAKTRLTNSAAPIEVEVEWTPLQGNNFLGYGIYRGEGSGTIVGRDYWREPLGGAYIDGDVNLRPGRTYNYQITALGTSYPEDPDAEGPRSSVVSAETLDDLFLTAPNFGTAPNSSIQFRWQAGSGAESYVVYLFDEYPGPGVQSIWNNASSPTTSNVLNYSGSALAINNTYYYVVLGLANSQRSRTISAVDSFVYR